ncbi:MAG: GatB/YqeY domain-containing protein [Candidatus Paceibacterota bacterium]
MKIEDIKKDLMEAQKAQNEIAVSVLRMLLSSIINKQKDKRLYIAAHESDLTQVDLDRREKLDDNEILEVIIAEAKKRRDSIFSFEEGSRPDLVEREQKELDFLKKYLPVELTEAEIRKIVEDVIAKLETTGQKNIGLVMKEVIPQTKGRADGYLVGKIVKEMIGE